MQHVNASYKTNLQQLNSLVLVKFDNDTMVEPRESEVCITAVSYDSLILCLSYLVDSLIHHLLCGTSSSSRVLTVTGFVNGNH